MHDLRYDLFIAMYCIGIGWSDKPDSSGGVSKKSASKYKISLEGLINAQERLMNSHGQKHSKCDQPSIIKSLIKEDKGRKRGCSPSKSASMNKKKEVLRSPSSKTLKQYFNTKKL